VFFYREEFGFVVEVTDGGAANAASPDSKDLILQSLQFGYAGRKCIGEQSGGCVGEKEANNCFQGEEKGFFLVAPGGTSQTFEEFQAGGDSCDEVVNMGGEGEVGVIGNTQEFWIFIKGEGDASDVDVGMII